MADEQLGLDATAAEQAVVSVFEQIVAVLARQADAAITDGGDHRRRRCSGWRTRYSPRSPARVKTG